MLTITCDYCKEPILENQATYGLKFNPISASTDNMLILNHKIEIRLNDIIIDNPLKDFHGNCARKYIEKIKSITKET